MMRPYLTTVSLLLLLLLVLLLVPIPRAEAWVPSSQCGGGQTVTWPSNSFPNTWVLRDKLSGARNFYSGMDDNVVITAITGGWDVWESPPSCGSAWRSTYGGTTTQQALSNSSQHIVEFLESSWPSGYGNVNSTIAVTMNMWSSCNYVDADQIYNGVGFNFDTTGSGQYTDLQSIAAHENGHWLGLDHTPITAATLYASYSGGTASRTLHSDDESGVCSLYPGSSVPTEDDCDDGIDNDSDGITDCDDSDCASDGACFCLAESVLGCGGSVQT